MTRETLGEGLKAGRPEGLFSQVPSAQCLVPFLTHRIPVDMTKSSTVRTASLKVFLLLHVRPINPVVFRGSLVPKGTCNTHLQGGFPLRCFQRLSLPHLATQRWTERSNWHTRGESLPILSY